MQTQYRKTDLVDLAKLSNSYTITEHDTLNEYHPFHITSLQHYNPIYSRFFALNESNVSRTTLKHKYAIDDLNTVVCTETGEHIPRPVFIKFSPLLDPVKYMIGKYDAGSPDIRVLPSLGETGAIAPHPKLADANNASYIDCFFSYLSSQLLHKHGLVNGIDFYGSFLGIQEKYKMNISDDLEYLCTSRFFNENVGSLFKVSEEIPYDGNYGDGSRANKQKLRIQNSLKNTSMSIIDLDIEDLTLPENFIEKTAAIPPDNTKHNTTEEDEIVYEKAANRSNTASSESSNNSSINYSTDDDGDDGDGDAEDSSSEPEESDDGEDGEEDDASHESKTSSSSDDGEEETIYSYMNNFPVQMICLEKCEGTIDHLLETGVISKKEGAAAMMQIVMTLIAYQRAFSFTHNDLHTNNVMYVPTDTEFLYYKYNKKTYQVPTYGRIFKIIDFGRSIYRFCGQIFCSDSFAPGGDAATQYNCEPYMTDKKPRLDPNPSFDLCRLGCAIYDLIMGEERDLDVFQKTICRWCCDDNKKNILYKKNGEERYPDFKLYKMIARTVHHHSPQDQLGFPFFSQFALAAKDVRKLAKSIAIMDIDEIPSYM